MYSESIILPQTGTLSILTMAFVLTIDLILQRLTMTILLKDTKCFVCTGDCLCLSILALVMSSFITSRLSSCSLLGTVQYLEAFESQIVTDSRNQKYFRIVVLKLLVAITK